MAGGKRPSSVDDPGDSDSGSNPKHPRFDVVAEHPGSNKKKAPGASRTGQACDRCKVRKIRCDARPGGCSPCLQNNTECRTTDRITGRATSRGHTENIENENANLRLHLIELQQQLRDNGIEPKSGPTGTGQICQSNGSASTTGLGLSNWENGSGTSWDTKQEDAAPLTSPTPTRSERKQSTTGFLPDFRSGCIGDNYLGVSSETNWLSPIEGTSLALFGMKIDLAEFMLPETAPSSTDMSYAKFLDIAFGKIKPAVPPLPSWDQCKFYADVYFKSVQLFVPILCRKEFMRLLEKIHMEAYAPDPAETVMVHMVLAILNFQFSARNSNERARLDSMAHYHYAVSLVPDLIAGHRLEDIQALCMICQQLRNQPRPAAGWMFTNLVLGIAVESGLHRSAKAWQDTGMAQDAHHLEMRKRTFWSLFAFHVHISGKLGRPMPLRFEDFDIEIPEHVADNTPEDYNEDTWKNCSFRAGIEGFKLLRIMQQVYATIYSVRSTGQYERNVRQLDKELEAFQDQLPIELRGGPKSKDEDRVAAFYIDMSVAECQLLLHHPSLCRSSSAELMNENLDICLHWSSRLLSSASQLKEIRSLDTSWFYSTDFLAAIFTTLFAYYERRDQITVENLQKLRDDMNVWVDIMSAIGVLLGSGSRLQGSIRSIVDTSLNHISRHLAAKTASAAVASAATEESSERSTRRQVYNTSDNYAEEFANGSSGVGLETTIHPESNYQPSIQHPTTSPTYTIEQPLSAYSDTQSSGSARFNLDPVSSYTTAPNYPMGEDMKQNINAGIAPNPAAQVNNSFQVPYHVPALSVDTAYQQMPPHAPGQTAWRQFTDTMVTNVSGAEYMHPLGAYMTVDPAGAPHKNGLPVNTMNGAMSRPTHIAMPHGPPIQPVLMSPAPMATPNMAAAGPMAWPMIMYGNHGAPPPQPPPH